VFTPARQQIMFEARRTRRGGVAARHVARKLSLSQRDAVGSRDRRAYERAQLARVAGSGNIQYDDAMSLARQRLQGGTRPPREACRETATACIDDGRWPAVSSGIMRFHACAILAHRSAACIR
jgi:hypothetical protein